MIQEIMESQLDEMVAEGLSLVTLGAVWCPDCVRVNPFLDTLSQEFSGNVKFFKIQSDAAKELKTKLGVRKIPTLIFYKNGQEVGERLIEPHHIDPIRKQIQDLL
ncbi:thiol reductase thioredoxin [Helicobacter monodelphidis]|uniref:thioredoxin family protein n=1 Tax=Helicobacter sp. 15-1451 TaxID=2004995 RepID=UPI000DCC5636|nr:thioredoxin family protein [Helicobacter sp. 15-1451]RAX58036.1 thiol reductase thioredoxin [Helicobacter sp. 15-1451]